MMLASPLDGIGVLDAAIVAVLGYAVVFFGLILLMCVVTAMGKYFSAKDSKMKAAASAAAQATAPAAPAASAVNTAKEQEILAAVIAAVTEDLGPSASRMQITSINKI